MAEEKTTNDKDSTVGVRIGDMIITALISAIISVMLLIVYDRYYAVKVAVLDLQQYIDNQRTLYLTGKLSDEQRQRNIEAVARMLSRLPKNTVVLSADVVLRNGQVIEIPNDAKTK